MHKTTIYLEQELYSHITRLAASRGATQAAIIREALWAYVKDLGEARKPRSIGIGASGDPDFSERSERYLEGFGQ